MALRLSQERFAYSLGAAPKTVRNWERGRHPPGLALKRALDEAWEATSAEQKERFFTSFSPTAPVEASASLELGDRAGRALGGPARVDEALVTSLADHAAALAGAFHAFPAESMIGPAKEHLEVVVRLTRRSMWHAHRRRLCALGADAATLIGWIALLLNRDAEASAHLALAESLAREAEDPALEAGVIGSMARACSPSLTWRGGDPSYALQLAERADALVSRAPALARSWVGERTAIEHACAGHALASDRALDQARETLGRGSDEAGLGGFIGRTLRMQDQWYLSTIEGLCHILLGRGKQAEVVLRSALDEASGTRTRLPIMLLGDLAAGFVLQDEPEAAVRALFECRSRSAQRSFAVGFERLRNVRRQFPASWAGLRCVAELDAALGYGAGGRS